MKNKMTVEEVQRLATKIGNISSNLGFTCPNNVKNPGLYFGATLALLEVFPVEDSDEELVERAKEKFRKKGILVSE